MTIIENKHLFDISKNIYKYFLYHNKKDISWTVIKNRVYNYLDSFLEDSNTSEGASVNNRNVDNKKRFYFYKIILLLLNLGLVDIKYCKNNIFYFSVTFPHYICKDSKKLLIGPSLILDREYQINTQQSIKELHNPALKILKQIEPIETLKKIIEKNRERNSVPDTQEQWNERIWITSNKDTGLFRKDGNGPQVYYLKNNYRCDVLPNDFLYSNAKTISYGLTNSKAITIENKKVTINCHINLLIMRALWADFMLNNLSDKNENNEENIKKIEEQFEKSETFENVSGDVREQIKRIFKGYLNLGDNHE